MTIFIVDSKNHQTNMTMDEFQQRLEELEIDGFVEDFHKRLPLGLFDGFEVIHDTESNALREKFLPQIEKLNEVFHEVYHFDPECYWIYVEEGTLSTHKFWDLHLDLKTGEIERAPLHYLGNGVCKPTEGAAYVSIYNRKVLGFNCFLSNRNVIRLTINDATGERVTLSACKSKEEMFEKMEEIAKDGKYTLEL